jgi:WD40 repeat protein
VTPGPDTDLLEAYLDGRLSPAEVVALEGRLKSEPGLALALVALSREEVILRRWAVAARVADAATPTAPAPPSPAPAARAGWRGRPPRPALLLAIAASLGLIVAAAVLALRGGRPEERPAGAFALLEDVEGHVSVRSGGQEEEPEAGRSVPAGAEVDTGEDSAAALRFPDGSRVLLSPGTRVGLAGGRAEGGVRVFLHEGSLEAEVARRADGRPMVVATPHAEIRAPGTRFRSFSTPDATRVEPEAGRVEVRRTSDNTTHVVETGSYAVAGGKDATVPFESLKAPPRVVQPRMILQLPGGRARDAAWAGGLLAALSTDEGAVHLWDAADGTPLRVLPGTTAKSLGLLAVAPDGRTLATAGERAVRLWNTSEGREFAGVPLARDVFAMAFSPDGRTLALAGRGERKDGQVRLIDLAEGLSRPPLAGFAREARSVAFGPGGSDLAVGTEDGTVLVFDRGGVRPPLTLPGHLKGVRCLAWSPDGRTLASGSADAAIRLWDLPSRGIRAVLTGSGPVRCLAFSPDGKWLATDAGGATARIWDAEGREQVAFAGHPTAVTGVAFSPDSRRLLTTGLDRRVLVWDLPGVP